MYPPWRLGVMWRRPQTAVEGRSINNRRMCKGISTKCRCPQASVLMEGWKHGERSATPLALKLRLCAHHASSLGTTEIRLSPMLQTPQARVLRQYVEERSVTPLALNYDFALITLSEGAPAGTTSLDIAAGQGTVTLDLTTAGYPADKSGQNMWTVRATQFGISVPDQPSPLHHAAAAPCGCIMAIGHHGRTFAVAPGFPPDFGSLCRGKAPGCTCDTGSPVALLQERFLTHSPIEPRSDH